MHPHEATDHQRPVGLGQERRPAYPGRHRVLLHRQSPRGPAGHLRPAPDGGKQRPGAGAGCHRYRCRNHPDQLQRFGTILGELRAQDIECQIIFLQADEPTLLKRFSETRRKHPLSGKEVSLADAIARERELLNPIAQNANLFIDTSHTNVHQLRDLVQERVGSVENRDLSLLFESFGFKHGIPGDADFVFDARCLPNPHWDPNLRPLTGRDQAVADFLDQHELALTMYEQIRDFLQYWLPHFKADKRSYLTVAIGCTGGQHRSVYLTERLATWFREHHQNVALRHRELP
jgi:RNase adapter protein RapZ